MTTGMTLRSDDERAMAGLAHASIALNFLTGGVGGFVAALVIWLTQRRESQWVGYQALQAVVYQLLGLALTFVGMMCWLVLYLGSLIPVMMNPDKYPEPPPAFFASLALLCIPLFFGILWTLYGLWGGLRAWQGNDFRYLILGDLLAKRTTA